MIDCQYHSGERCQLAESLLTNGAACPTTEGMCNACKSWGRATPENPGYTVVSLAYRYDKATKPLWEQHSRKDEPKKPKGITDADWMPLGVGDAFKRMAQHRWNVPEGCPACEAARKQMNEQGVEWCREHAYDLAVEIYPRAKGWAIHDATWGELWDAAKAAVRAGGPVNAIMDLVLAACDEVEASQRPFDLALPDGSDGRLAVVAALFNPSNADVIHENWKRWREHLESFNLHSVTTVQLLWEGQEQLGDIAIGAAPNQVAFQKEALLNIGFRSLPPEVSRVAWLDCDLIFPRDFTDSASEALDTHAAVQLFSVVDRQRTAEGPYEPWACAPGGAWAADKRLLPDGLYDRCVLGGGDQVFHAALNGESRPGSPHATEWAKGVYQRSGGKHTRLPETVTHLYHGDRDARKYHDRRKWLRDAGYNPETDVCVASNGLLQWTRDDLARLSEEYFKTRTAEFA